MMLGAIRTETIPDLRPARDLLPEPMQSDPVFLIAAGVLLLGFLLGLVLWFRARLLRPVPPIPPATRAFAALKGLPSPADALEVRGIFTHYLQETFGLQAAALVPLEIQETLAKLPGWQPSHSEKLLALLEPLAGPRFAPRAEPADGAAAAAIAREVIATVEAMRCKVQEVSTP